MRDRKDLVIEELASDLIQLRVRFAEVRADLAIALEEIVRLREGKESDDNAEETSSQEADREEDGLARH